MEDTPPTPRRAIGDGGAPSKVEGAAAEWDRKSDDPTDCAHRLILWSATSACRHVSIPRRWLRRGAAPRRARPAPLAPTSTSRASRAPGSTSPAATASTSERGPNASSRAPPVEANGWRILTRYDVRAYHPRTHAERAVGRRPWKARIPATG